MRRLLLLGLLLPLVAPHAALAGTASVGSITVDAKYGNTVPALLFAADAGERNRIAVARSSTTGALVLHDAGAPVRAAAGCTAHDAHTVSCAANTVFIDAGDGDDAVTVATGATGYAAYVRGGDGNDVLTGEGVLSGGAGNDVLTCPGACRDSVFAGGPGDDVLRGGSGDDVLSGDGEVPASPLGYTTLLTESGPAGNDRIDGGPGRDQLTYRGRRAGVRVDLAAGTATGVVARGERDRLSAIEDVVGGDGDDVLLGDAGPNSLAGGSGDDRIGGRGGADELFGNLPPDAEGFTVADPGADALSGGSGDDVLDAGSEPGDALVGGPGNDVLRDGTAGTPRTRARKVDCGTGRDTIEFVPQGQLVARCELLAVGAGARIGLRPRPQPGGRLRFAWGCRELAGCTLAIAVRVGPTAPARRTVAIRGVAERSLLVTPRRAARRGRVVEVRANVVLPYASRSAHWRVRL